MTQKIQDTVYQVRYKTSEDEYLDAKVIASRIRPNEKFNVLKVREGVELDEPFDFSK